MKQSLFVAALLVVAGLGIARAADQTFTGEIMDSQCAQMSTHDKMMKGQGYGEGYIYDHNTPEGFSGQEYFPEKLGRQNFYRPVERGFEREITKRLDYFSRLRAKKAEDGL